jgi:uncharacterized protein (DUF1499 family)
LATKINADSVWVETALFSRQSVASNLHRNGGMDGVDLWSIIFGQPDLGAVTFTTLVRRQSPNDALVAPADACAQAKPDKEPPVFPVPAERLRSLVAAVAWEERGTTILEQGTGPQDRYLVRSLLFRFPDTVNVEVLERGEGRSTLALYARSQIGRKDFGANRRRLERWLAGIEAKVREQAPRGH